MASFPSSYIPTVAAAATRAADILVYTAGVSYPVSMWAEFERVVNTATNERILGLQDAAAQNNVSLICNAVPLAQFFAVASNSTVANIVAGSTLINVINKSAARAAASDYRIASNGTLGTANTSAIAPAASPTLFTIGHQASSGQPFGYIRRAAVFNSALTDAQLTTTTS